MSIQDGLPTPARYYAMAVVLLGIAMTVLDGTIVNLALPRITHDLQASAAHSVRVVNAYQISTLAAGLSAIAGIFSALRLRCPAAAS